ncbi:hypothetical protein SAMN05518866_10543 [Sphingobium sp. YR768]|nr:hypothetical protein SAMN05518866_10543 [Sphingobium sp. YR768]
MNEPKAFNVHFRCEDREIALAWLNKFRLKEGCAYGDLRKIGNIDFKSYMFVVSFLNEDDSIAMRKHFYSNEKSLNN